MIPYDFVPFPDHVPRETPIFRDVLEGYSGIIECELEALSPLLIMDSNPDFRYNRDRPNEPGYSLRGIENDRFVIPGSSLKGMVRSVAEVLRPSCGVKNCRNKTELCAACRLFGFVAKDDILKGPVNIGQATAEKSTKEIPAFRLVPMESPHLDNVGIYRSKGNPVGRKFYFHQERYQEDRGEKGGRGPLVQPLDRGARFKFAVTFKNLKFDDLSLLVAALVLSDEAPLAGGLTKVRHKLGYGKPAGLGSVRIDIVRVQLDDDGEQRYQAFDAKLSVLESGSTELQSWVREKQEAIFTNPTIQVQKLIEILRYPQAPGVIYEYPEYVKP